MTKTTYNLFALFVAVLVWQLGCAGGERSKIVAVNQTATETPTPLVEPSVTAQNAIIDIKIAETEAQALLDAGIKFEDTINADGETSDGGLYTGHGYKSSDGVEISTDRGLYKRAKNAKKDCDDVLEEIDKILKKERMDSGFRIVATLKQGGFVVAYNSTNVCNVYTSSSLKHLLAFEKWRDN